MSDTDTVLSWPDEHTPENSAFHAVNQLQMDAQPEAIWAWLCRPDLWPTYYSNAKFIKHLAGPWPEIQLGTRFRWWSFGAFVTSEVVEFEPAERIAWDAKVLGGRGYHGWLLRPQDGGTFVRTEETQKGWGIVAVKPALRPMMVRLHQRWLEGLSRVAAEGPPPPAS
ncbi:MAG TPA: SRPBCC family protein [Solirubrobacterales bacterium]